ncbi:alpha/beta-hydrolase [Meredithblackwellia eburnea MCA 4105]
MTSSRPGSPGPHDRMHKLFWPKGSSIDTINEDETKVVVIMLHGRGSNPNEDLPVFESVFQSVAGGDPNKVVVIGLNARDEIWFPEKWSAPIAAQEPYLSSALGVLHSTIQSLPIPPSRILLLGFSQGSGLAMTYALKNPCRLGGIVALSGSIVGNPEDWTSHSEDNGGLGGHPTLDGTPCYIAWGEADRYYEVLRTERDVKALHECGAATTLEIFPNMGHYVTPRELDKLEEMLLDIVGRDPAQTESEIE